MIHKVSDSIKVFFIFKILFPSCVPHISLGRKFISNYPFLCPSDTISLDETRPYHLWVDGWTQNNQWLYSEIQIWDNSISCHQQYRTYLHIYSAYDYCRVYLKVMFVNVDKAVLKASLKNATVINQSRRNIAFTTEPNELFSPACR